MVKERIEIMVLSHFIPKNALYKGLSIYYATILQQKHKKRMELAILHSLFIAGTCSLHPRYKPILTTNL